MPSIPTDKEKQCSLCHKWLDRIEHFDPAQTIQPDLYDDWCKRCKSGEKRARTHYGITTEAYAREFRLRKGRCKICGEHENVCGQLVIDHDHTTRAFRGLLCTNCNLGLGNFKDDPTRLAGAITYLERVASKSFTRLQCRNRTDPRIYLRGSIYWVRWSTDGKQHRKSLGTKDRRRAEKLAVTFPCTDEESP